MEPPQILVDNGLLISVLTIVLIVLWYIGNNILKALVKLPETIQKMNDMLERFKVFLEKHEQTEKDVLVIQGQLSQAKKDVKECEISILSLREANHELRTEYAKCKGRLWMIEEKLGLGHLE